MTALEFILFLALVSVPIGVVANFGVALLMARVERRASERAEGETTPVVPAATRKTSRAKTAKSSR